MHGDLGGVVLIAEDDNGVRESLSIALRHEGYTVLAVDNGDSALGSIRDHDPDVVILDIVMPGRDGIDVCRQMRSDGDTRPVLMLTARQTVSDRVAGLDAGADDYLTKPFALDELLARVRAMMRRVVAAADDPADEIRVGELVINRANRRVERDGVDLQLTKTEFDLLDLLARHAGRVLTRDEIYDQIWGFSFETTSRSLDVYVSYLRRKTEAGGASRLIETVRGVGFLLVDA